MFILRRFLLCLAILFFGMSCINTSYSRKDEQSISSEALDLILGQFAHHGESFYKKEVTRTQRLLEKTPNDFMARNDLASAYIKLARYDDAEKEFLRNEELHPKKYETAANLGVLYKKMKRFDEAAAAIQRSLDIKPEGHMGLGDYYLRMIQWLEIAKNSTPADPTNNFLGIPYGDSPELVANHPLVNKEYLLTLIINDYKFPDVYCVLGDVYFAEGNYQYALRCYYRAQDLSFDGLGSIYYTRYASIFKHWESQQTESHVLSERQAYDQIYAEFRQASDWLAEFKKVEQARIAQNLPVDFNSTKQALLEKGIERQKILTAGFFEGEEERSKLYSNSLYYKLVVTSICAALGLAAIFYLLYRRLSKRKK